MKARNVIVVTLSIVIIAVCCAVCYFAWNKLSESNVVVTTEDDEWDEEPDTTDYSSHEDTAVQIVQEDTENLYEGPADHIYHAEEPLYDYTPTIEGQNDGGLCYVSNKDQFYADCTDEDARKFDMTDFDAFLPGADTVEVKYLGHDIDYSNFYFALADGSGTDPDTGVKAARVLNKSAGYWFMYTIPYTEAEENIVQ